MALVKIKGDNVPTNDLFELAELMVLAVDGYISPEAETIFRQVLSRDSSNGGARYYLGLMFAQLDRPDRSFEIWRNLLEKAPIMLLDYAYPRTNYGGGMASWKK